MIYHITSRDEWNLAKSEGVYRCASLPVDGFIHCSTKEQLLGVANALFHGRTDLVLLCIDPELVEAEIKYEDLYETMKLYPHIYGELNLNSIRSVIEFPPSSDGTFSLPQQIDG